MTRRDEVIRMAREAGICAVKCADGFFVQGGVSDSALERFAALVAAEKQEQCAKVVEATDVAKELWAGCVIDDGSQTKTDCAAAIRALKDEVSE